MERIEILVEEASMEECLKNLLPCVVPNKWKLDQNYFIRKHQGKSDLKKSIRTKLPIYKNFHEPISVIILHDQDSADCKILKKELLNLSSSFKKNLLIRIVCRELESWFLGDLKAIEKAYPNFKSNNYLNKRKLMKPDLLNAKDYLKKILPNYREVASSREISKYLDINDNRSESFNSFINGIKKIFDNDYNL